MQLEDATILVTGANGFVGSAVSRRLATGGASVRALVRRPGETPLLDLDRIEEVEGDFTDADTARRAVAGADAVVHCAATVGADLEQARRVNTRGTRTIATAALAAGCDRFVHLSTEAVYDRSDDGDLEEDHDRVTDTDPDAADPYSRTKAEAEEEVAAASWDGLRTVILRPPAVLGVHASSTWGVRVPERIRDGRFAARRSGDATFAWVHVDDLVEAVVLALTEDAAVGRTYNVAGGTTTWGRYVADVRSWFDDAPDPLAGDGSGGWRGRYPTDRVRAELGWEPRRSYDEAIAEIAAHWRGGPAG